MTIFSTFKNQLGGAIDVLGRATGNRVKEYGISERLQGLNPVKTAYAAEPKVLGSQAYQTPFIPGVTATPRSQQQTNTSGGGGGGIIGGNLPGYDTSGQEGTINENTQDLQALADYEFEQALGVISQEEGGIKQQSAADIKAQEAQGVSASNRASEAKTAQLGGLEEEGQTATTQKNTSLRDTRDLFRQIQQENIAKLSSLGISSSSVTEALAEKLGVETARRISGITGTYQEVIQNIAKEKTRVETVFQNKLSEIQQATDAAISQIRAGASQQLAALGRLRGEAATQKAEQRTDIAINARNQIQQLRNKAAQYSQSVQAAAARRAQALEEAEKTFFNPTDFQGIGQYYSNLIGSLPQQAGFSYVPQPEFTSVEGRGFIAPGIGVTETPQNEEDLLAKYGIQG